MFAYCRLLDAIDSDISDTARCVAGSGFQDAYARLCGQLSLEDLFTTDSVYIAAQRASVGFQAKRDTERFMKSPWERSLALCDRVLNGKFVPMYYSPHVIRERGKERLIVPPTFECKVVQKVLCEMLLRPLLTHRMISSSYASITGRGTNLMYEDIVRTLNHTIRSPRMDWRDCSVVMCDYRSYFASIDVYLLERLVFRRYISDERVIGTIMSFFPEPVGLPIGSEISQMPATFYPSPVDHMMRDKWGLPYFRYMDDTLAIVPNELVDTYIAEYRRVSDGLRLSCPDDKVRIVPMGRCFSFCKERFRFVRHGDARYVREINPRRVSTERRKLARFEEMVRAGDMPVGDAVMQASGVIGSIRRHPRSGADVASLLEQVSRIEDAGRHRHDGTV